MRIRPTQWWVLVPLLAALWIVLDHKRLKAPHTAEWLDAGGVLVRAVRAGKGDTTLLLLHGYGESLTTWRAVFDRLAARWKVIAIDLPGFGGAPSRIHPTRCPPLTNRLSSFIDHWTTGPMVVVGHSMGESSRHRSPWLARIA